MSLFCFFWEEFAAPPLSSAASGPHTTPHTFGAGWSVLAVRCGMSLLNLKPDAYRLVFIASESCLLYCLTRLVGVNAANQAANAGLENLAFYFYFFS